VPEPFRLGSRELAAQRRDAHPGRQVDGREAEFEPDGVDGEVVGGEAAEAGGLAAPDVVLDACVPAVTDLQEPRGAATAVRPEGRAVFPSRLPKRY
jgi:hypothetical protein